MVLAFICHFSALVQLFSWGSLSSVFHWNSLFSSYGTFTGGLDAYFAAMIIYYFLSLINAVYMTIVFLIRGSRD